MLKLLQINVTCNWGSTGRIAEEIGKLAIAEGWESYIAYGRSSLDSTSEKIQIGTKKDYYAHALLSRVTDRTGFYSKAATTEFLKQIDTIQPDIIHLHNIHGYYVHIGLLFDYIAKHQIPIIWTLHDCWAFTGHCVYFDLEGCNRWKSGCYSCPLKRRGYPASFVMDQSKRNYKEKKKFTSNVQQMTLVPVSDWLGGLIKESFLGNREVRVIHNGIDTDLFTPKESKGLRERYGIERKQILLGVASVWEERKGLGDFIQLSKILDTDKVIVLIGVNDKIKSTLPQNVIGISRTNSIEELGEWYSAADVVLNLSYEETFGLTTIEGFACGTPGVVYNATASPELITENTGLIVEKGNVNKLLKAINNILAKGKEHYSTACRERAVACFNKQDKFSEYIDLYRDVLKQ